jgi:branched-subunit amino acid aminotransferase/4-amino-4-deoxychorismate lyase
MPDLIETVRIRGGVAPLWYLHLRRLAGSCKALGIPLPGELPTPGRGADRVHRIQAGLRGASASERPVGPDDPVRLVTVSGVVHRPYPHKTTDRAQFAHAIDQARTRGADDGLLLAEGGWVAEAGIWSLFWWEDGRVAAPPLALGVLPGVARARIAEQTGGVVERRVQMDQIRGRSLFVANAVRGVVPVAALDGVAVRPNDATNALAREFWP